LVCKISRVYDQIQATITNTSLTPDDSVTLIVNQQEVSTNFRANVGQFAIYAMGGTHTVSALTVDVKQKKGADLLVVGDSRVNGSASNYSNNFVSLLSEMFNGIIDNYAGGGNRNQDYVAAEVLALAPKKILILSGTNNQADGDNAATTATALQTFTSSLTGYSLGSTLFYCDEIPKGSADMSGYSSAYKTTLGTSGCIFTYTSFSAAAGTGPDTTLFDSSELHFNNKGNQQLTNIAASQIGLTKKNVSKSFNSKPYFQGSRLALGNEYLVPNHMLEVVDITGMSQVRIGHTSSRNGGFLFSKASNQLNMLGGYYNNGNSQNIAAETSGSGVVLNAGVIAFTAFSGATIGNTVTATEIARFSNTGLLGIGLSPTKGYLEIKAGTTSIAPLTFTSGTNKSTASAGDMEYNGTNLFFTRSGTTRENVICASAVNSVSPTSPNRTITVNINGTTYYIHAKTTND
jgi:hypothetical protein